MGSERTKGVLEINQHGAPQAPMCLWLTKRPVNDAHSELVVQGTGL